MTTRTLPICKSCDSEQVYKHGTTSNGVQRFRCQNCKATFTASDTLPRMRVSVDVIAAAVSMFYEGLSLNAIRRQIDQMHGIYPSDSTVYDWIIRFTKTAVTLTNRVCPKMGNTWTADETVLKIGGSNTWFWDIIDEDTRFLLASHISMQRRITDARTLMRKACERAGKSPKVVITDKLAAYLQGIESVFGADAKHIQSGPFKLEKSTRAIERFHGTLKARTKIMRGMANRETATLIMEGWLFHYNYLRPHQGLKNKTPAQAAGIEVPFRNWIDIVRQG